MKINGFWLILAFISYIIYLFSHPVVWYDLMVCMAMITFGWAFVFSSEDPDVEVTFKNLFPIRRED